MGITVTAEQETLTPSNEYWKMWKKDDTGELFLQPQEFEGIFSTVDGRKIDKTALASGYTEQQKWSVTGSNLSTVS